MEHEPEVIMEGPDLPSGSDREEGVEGEPDLADLEVEYENPYPHGFHTDENEVPVYLVPRDEWGAVPAKEEVPITHPLGHLLFTYTHTPSCYDLVQCTKTMRALQKKNMEIDGMPDIQYNFYISGDMTVYEGRGWNNYFTEPHYSYKDKSLKGKILSICYIGRFNGQDDYPSVGVAQVRNQLAEYAVEEGYLKDMFSSLHVLIHPSDLDELIRKQEALKC